MVVFPCKFFYSLFGRISAQQKFPDGTRPYKSRMVNSRIGFSIIARGNSKYGKVSAAVCTYIYIGTRRFDSGADKAHGRHTAEPRMQVSLRRATKPRMKTAHGIPATHVRAQNSNPNLILVGFKAAEVPRTPSGDNPPLAAASHALPQVRCTT